MQHQRLPRREREKLRQRRQMLDAALELFSEKGYHNVSMHEIADKAEFAIGTLYKFFKNKEDLYKALMMEKAEEYHRVLTAILAREDDVLHIIDAYIATKARLFTDSLATLRLYFAETRGASFNIKAGLDQDIRRLYDTFVKQLASVLAMGSRQKVFRDLDPYCMALALEGLTNAFLFCWLEEPEKHPYEANVPLIREMFLRGVLAR
jgi:AcrR family transcriptional regulator